MPFFFSQFNSFQFLLSVSISWKKRTKGLLLATKTSLHNRSVEYNNTTHITYYIKKKEMAITTICSIMLSISRHNIPRAPKQWSSTNSTLNPGYCTLCLFCLNCISLFNISLLFIIISLIRKSTTTTTFFWKTTKNQKNIIQGYLEITNVFEYPPV